MCRDSRWRRSWPVLWCLPSRRRAWGAGGEGGTWKGMERCYYYYRQSECLLLRLRESVLPRRLVRTEKVGGWLLPSPYARKAGGRAGLQLARELLPVLQSCGFAPCPSALPRRETRERRETSNDTRVTTTARRISKHHCDPTPRPASAWPARLASARNVSFETAARSRTIAG